MTALHLLTGALCLALAAGCAHAPQGAAPVPRPPTRPDPQPPVRQPPPAKPKSDVQKDPVACTEARAQLTQLTRAAAAGCSETTPCIVDNDCLVRTIGADPTSISEARMTMERACTPSGDITRLSCIERPAPCREGRCVPPPGDDPRP